MEDQKPVPDLAESSSWSDDKKTLTVKLRNNVFFHDGTQLTGEDIRFTFENVQDPIRKSPLAPLFHGLTIELDPTDPLIIRFILTKPDVTFIDRLTLGILPAHLWGEVPPENVRLSNLNIKPIGSGPYRVKSFLRDTIGNVHSYTLERFPEYYGAKPNLTTVIFQFFPDQQSAFDAFKSDLVGAIALFSASDALKTTATSRTHDLKLQLPEETVAFFNIKDKVLASKDVRQALTLSLSRSEILSAVQGGGVPITGPYSFGPVTSITPEVTRARELLTSAGWKLPENGNVRTKSGSASTSTAALSSTSGTELALTILVPTDHDLLAIAEVLKREWSLIGIKVTIEEAEPADLMRKATRTRSTQVVLLNIFLGAEQDLFPFWWSGQSTDRGLNFSGLSDRAVDDALDATKNTTTTEALLSAREAVNTAIQKHFPASFLIRPIHHYLISSSVHGNANELTLTRPSERLFDLMKWYTKTGWKWQ